MDRLCALVASTHANRVGALVVAIAAALLVPVRSNAQMPAGVAVSGSVQDQTGGILPAASVELLATDGTVLQSTVTTGNGDFRLEGVAPGNYELRSTFEGLAPATVRIRVATRAVTGQRLVLKVATFRQEITVTNGGGQVDTTAAANADAVALDQSLLAGLPVFDQDVIGTLSRFLDAGSLGTGGVTIVVNGMEVSALRVTASAIQQIRVNQDPYSAEYSRPGRGRIEILTKPGGREYHGEFNALLRDAQFDARNAFAETKPDEQKHGFEGVFGGPIGSGGKTAFVLSARDQQDDQQALVFATGLTGAIRDAVPQSNRESLLSFSVIHQWSDTTTVSIRPNIQYESEINRGVGGETLASAGTSFTHTEQQLTYTQQTIIRPNLVNQFQILFGHEREPTSSASAAPRLVVAGAFTGGGGQEDLVRTETHIQLMESLAWTRGAHLVQAGFQLPDWSRRGFFDQSNFGGTFYFSGLEAYAAGTPYSFTQQQGNGDVVLLEKQVGVYVKDDWRVSPSLSASLGLRYDWQNFFHDNNNLAPRLSVAVAPGNHKTNVIRAGLGLFNDRSGPVVIADVLHSQPGGLIRQVITDPSYPIASPASGSVPPPSIVRLADDVQIPQTLQYSLGLDRQLGKTTALSVTYTGSRGYHMFRSRDVNAPAPPAYSTRPDPAFGVIREVESNGRQTNHSLQISLRGRTGTWLTGQTQYTVSRTENDTNGINAFPANDYDLASEWGRADQDRLQRLVLLGRIGAPKIADFGIGLTMNSAAPYSETLGDDIYNNGRGRARPAGLERNSLEGAGFASVDLRASRVIKLRGGSGERAVSIAVDAFNILNHVNYGTFVGTIGSPLFGQPVTARSARQIQLSARLTF